MIEEKIFLVIMNNRVMHYAQTRGVNEQSVITKNMIG